MGPEVHSGRVEPNKKGFVVLGGTLNKLLRTIEKLEVDRLHAFFIERPGISYAPIRKAVHNAPRSKPLTEGGVLGIVGIFGLLLGIQVIEVAKELVKPVLGGQKLIAVTQVVLAKLPRGIALFFQERGEGHILRPDTQVSARHPHLGQAGANRGLPGDKRGAPCGTTLLTVIVGELGTLIGDAVNVGRLVAHHAHVVSREIPKTDVITPNHQNIGSLHRRYGCTRQPDRKRAELNKPTQHAVPL